MSYCPVCGGRSGVHGWAGAGGCPAVHQGSRNLSQANLKDLAWICEIAQGTFWVQGENEWAARAMRYRLKFRQWLKEDNPGERLY